MSAQLNIIERVHQAHGYPVTAEADLIALRASLPVVHCDIERAVGNRVQLSLYFAMKNTPKVGSVSNFWGAVQRALKNTPKVGSVSNFWGAVQRAGRSQSADARQPATPARSSARDVKSGIDDAC
ncbi:hypothetical protein BTHE68_53500 [Burkholderia sp. THE68]|uniref:hypothetical protein n=1 Tax=Burkholderia sp. THE68 TaxID=758782 RepID=UPI0013164C21|nr:hypothetical protein [Burkholderia sp. THE68]BBU31616.1 hypothetical protein BTHE68_53500 [Burkholderia sp. THE68]